MRAAALRFGQRRLRLQSSHHCATQYRHASLTRAISRGVRKGQKSAEDRRRGYDDLSVYKTGRKSAPVNRDEEQGRDGWSGDTQSQSHGHGHSYRPTINTQADYSVEAPRTIPYTAADSEFLYGLHSVEAALKANRRTFHKLFVYAAEDGGVRSLEEKELYRLVRKANIEPIRVGGPEWKQKLSQMAAGRAHNGFVLEASPLPTPLIKSLDEVEYAGAPWKAQVDGDVPLHPFHPKADNRYPLLLLLDAITDTGNIGAILRSAYYFGVDAIIRPEFGSASTAAMLKASAGAAEIFPIFRIRNEVDFLLSSQANGWHISSAVPPDAEVRVATARRLQPAASRQTPDRILESKPMVLILGNEGEGVRPKLSRISDSFSSIQDAPGVHDGVDSLNVSVAAAVLMRDFLKPFLIPGQSLRSGEVALPVKGKVREQDIF